MRIGLPRERKRDEYRVGLMPGQVARLTGSGHTVLVEQGAGVGAGHTDDEYASSGARVVARRQAYDEAELIVKVKCPLPEEYEFLRSEHALFAYLHFDENIAPDKIQRIVQTGVTGIAYEWVQEGDRFPLLQPMSELTGVLFAARAAELLMAHKGKLPGAFLPGQEPAQALVIGCGHIGSNAVHYFLRNGVRVTIVDKTPGTIGDRMLRYAAPQDWDRWQGEVEVIQFRQDQPERSVAKIAQQLPTTDMLICSAVRRPSFPKEACEFLVDAAGVRSMAAGSVVCDATACDRDLVETCVSSDRLTETETIEGVVHYSCDHIPSYVPRTATQMLTAATFPYVALLAEGVAPAIGRSEALRAGVMCRNGTLTHRLSAEKKGMAFVPVGEVL